MRLQSYYGRALPVTVQCKSEEAPPALRVPVTTLCWMLNGAGHDPSRSPTSPAPQFSSTYYSCWAIGTRRRVPVAANEVVGTRK